MHFNDTYIRSVSLNYVNKNFCQVMPIFQVQALRPSTVHVQE